MVLRLIFGLLAFAAALGAVPSAVAQGSEELRCRAMVDGQVAWNKAGDTVWSPANVEALCAGTTDAAARIACFKAGIAAHDDWSRAIADCAAAGDGAAEQAPPPPAPETAPVDEAARCREMVQGKVAWNRGGDMAWDPSNIDALCAGTTDADARIACFEAGIAAHDDWDRAIRECKALGDQAEPAAGPRESAEPGRSDESALCKAMFDGKIPMSLPNGSTAWDPAKLERLCAATPNAAETLKCFIKTLINDGGPPTTTDAAIEFCRWK